MNTDQRSVMEFPCRFPIKAMGRTDSALEYEVENLMRRHVPNLKGEDITTRPSARGNYVSITITITATSREQLDAIYLDLNAHDAILMTL